MPHDVSSGDEFFRPILPSKPTKPEPASEPAKHRIRPFFMLPASGGKTKRFDCEMEKHGLKSKIKDIESLNTYFESQLGKIQSNVTASDSSTASWRKLDFSSTSAAGQEKSQQRGRAIVFPYQRRARSFSPPKDEASSPSKPFSSRLNRSIENSPRAGPVLAKNFMFGRDLIRSMHKKKGSMPLVVPQRKPPRGAGLYFAL